MELKSTVYCLGLGVFLIWILNWIYFFNWIGLIGKLVNIMAPHKKIEEIDFNRRLREKDEFIIHLKKWKIIFLLHPLSFVITFLITLFVSKSMLIAYFAGLIVTAIQYRFLGSLENKEKKEIIKLLRNNNG